MRPSVPTFSAPAHGSSGKRRLRQEARSLVRDRQHTTIGGTEPAQPSSGDEVVDRVPEANWQQPQSSGEAPWPTEACQHPQRCFGSEMNSSVILEHNGRGCDRQVGDQPGRCRALQRRELEDALSIARDDELHEAVTQAAVTVVEDNRPLGGPGFPWHQLDLIDCSGARRSGQ